MNITFWGVRGSIPAPLLPVLVQSKISAVLERVRPGDIQSAESRERFLGELPSWIFGSAGGNTACTGIALDSLGDQLVFDAGSGIRELGISAAKQGQKNFHIFFSQLRGDRLQGLPFFCPAGDPAARLAFYGPFNNLAARMNAPHFPVQMAAMAAKKAFHPLRGPLLLGRAQISFKKMNHSGGLWSYKVREGKRSFIYAAGAELSSGDFQRTGENAAYFGNAGVIALGAARGIARAGGAGGGDAGSACRRAVDFAAHWEIGHLVFFHHGPAWDDRALDGMLQAAREYAECRGMDLRISLALEGMEIAL